MNIKLIVIIILLLFSIILYISYYIYNIEKFNTIDDIIKNNLTIYPPSSNYTADNLSNTIDDIKQNFDIKFTTYENFQISNNSIKDNNLALYNGYGTYYIFSSFKIDKNSLISNLFKLHNNSPIVVDNTNINNITLTDNTSVSGNYIIFKYLQNIEFNRIIINTDINLSRNIDIYYTTDELLNNYTKIPIKFNNKIDKNNNIITGINLENLTSLNTLLILFNNTSIKSFTLNYINIYAIPQNIDISDSGIIDNSIKQIDNTNALNLIINPSNTDEENEDISNLPISDKFNSLITYKIPWGIYNGSITKDNKLVDLLGREDKNAIINNEYSIIANEITIYNDKNVNIPYLKGTTSTQIIFPEGSLSALYTICVISRYTNRLESNKRNRILTSIDNNPDWILGHWNDKINVMNNSNSNKLQNTFITDTIQSNTNWLVSCCKSTAQNISKGVLFNGVFSGKFNCGILDKDTRLCINASQNKQESDFGLSYLVIWNKILTDTELKIASDMFINYLTTQADFKLNVIVYSKDGSTEERAADSAMNIKLMSGTNKDGIYWINIPVKNNKGEITSYTPTPTYCIMNSICHGGGWMLAIKGASNSGVFTYSSKYWTTPETLNTSNTDMSNTDAKFDIFNRYVFNECMAIFSKEDTNGKAIRFPNNPEYGWTWVLSPIFKKLSLLDFFAGNYSQYFYASINNNLVELNNPLIRQYKFSMNDFNNYVVKLHYHHGVWSQQNRFKAYGFNVSPGNFKGVSSNSNHSARWGGTFNENNDGLPNSNDVSGGIGVSNKRWNAGDCIGCCESSRGLNKQMGFKWFIR